MSKKYLCLIIAMVLFISGCSGGDNSEKYQNYDFSYDSVQLGYDAQSFFELTFSEITSTESGYYYFDTSYKRSKTPSSDIYLMFFDRETGQAVPVCGQANCNHEIGDSCDALFTMMNAENPIISVRGLWYYNGDLYTVLTELDGSMSLYKISLDGSVRTKYITLFEGGSDGTFNMYYHRGYIYIALSPGDKASLYRVKIEKDAELELIYEMQDSDYYIKFGGITPYKNGIAISAFSFSYTDEGMSGIDIMYYNPENGEVEKLVEKINYDSYLIIDSSLYYTQNGDIYIYNLETEEEMHFYTCDHPVYISYDGNYLYAEACPVSLDDYSEHNIYVLDLEGNLVDTIQAPSSQDCYFGDKDYLFQMFDLNEELTGKSEMAIIKAFDKSQIGTGEYKWIELPINQ